MAYTWHLIISRYRAPPRPFLLVRSLWIFSTLLASLISFLRIAYASLRERERERERERKEREQKRKRKRDDLQLCGTHGEYERREKEKKKRRKRNDGKKLAIVRDFCRVRVTQNIETRATASSQEVDRDRDRDRIVFSLSPFFTVHFQQTPFSARCIYTSNWFTCVCVFPCDLPPPNRWGPSLARER